MKRTRKNIHIQEDVYLVSSLCTNESEKIKLMKRIVFLSFLVLILLFYKNVKSQYIPLLKDSNQWNVQVVGCCPFVTTEIYKIANDTVISNQIWKSIVYSIDSNVNAVFNNRFYLREDSINKRLYALDNNFDSKLYFDFNLTLNDTTILFNPMFNITDTFVVTGIEFQLIGGIQRKKIRITSNSFIPMEEIWIEGIGSEKGIFYGNPPPYVGSPLVSLICFFYNNQLIYHKQGFDYCYYSNVGIDINYKESFKLYPNPATDYIYIENIKEKTTVSVYNISSQLIKEVIVNEDSKIFLNNLSEGMYFVRIQNNIYNFTQKLIINRKK